MNKKTRRNILSLALVAAMLFSICPAAAAEGDPDTAENGVNSVIFTDVSQLTQNASIERIVEDPNGNRAVIGIECVAERETQQRTGLSASARSRDIRVWYNGLVNNAEFYMTVSNNRVTSVYDYSITVIGGSYEDASLSHTSTYGKLTYTLKAIGGVTASTCWLKGTVTGVDDQIEVTWQM